MFRILSRITVETAYSQREENQTKAWFQGNFFHFQVFQTFANLEIDFGINLSKYFW